VTIDHQEATGTARANGAPQQGPNGVLEGPVSVPVRERDVRRKRPPVLLFLLRLETLRRVVRVLSLLILDFIGVAGALVTALAVKVWIQGDHSSFSIVWDQTRHWLAFAYLITVLMFARVDLYADRTRRPGFAQIGTALFQATIIALVFALANGEHFSSYYIFYSSLFFGTIYITALRELHLRTTGWLLEQAGYQRRALLVGSGKHIEAVAHALANRARTQVLIVGYISLQPRPQNGLRSLGKLDDLPDVLDRERVQEVIIADPDFPQDKAVELVDLCHQSGVSVHVAPSTMEILIDRAEFVPGQIVPLFTLRPPVFEGIDYALKRTFDLVLSVIGLVVLSPVLLAIAAAIKLSSRGPAIYRSVRPGIAGKPFFCFKFRTMREHAEQIQDELEPFNELSGALFKIRDDPRLTTVGRFLRRFSLDELPQLVNVVRGDMSMVGPRPLPIRDFERLEEWHKKRYLVLPGITGLWQVSGRSELDFDDLVRLDFLYLERWSILLDLSILLKTIPAVLTRRGAF
jgi:exopolysaccharide biosynthesis polyprenyl glycosylphosphotransferase